MRSAGLRGTEVGESVDPVSPRTAAIKGAPGRPLTCGEAESSPGARACDPHIKFLVSSSLYARRLADKELGTEVDARHTAIPIAIRPRTHARARSMALSYEESMK